MDVEWKQNEDTVYIIPAKLNKNPTEHIFIFYYSEI
jgi:hypothetical protein